MIFFRRAYGTPFNSTFSMPNQVDKTREGILGVVCVEAGFIMSLKWHVSVSFCLFNCHFTQNQHMHTTKYLTSSMVTFLHVNTIFSNYSFYRSYVANNWSILHRGFWRLSILFLRAVISSEIFLRHYQAEPEVFVNSGSTVFWGNWRLFLENVKLTWILKAEVGGRSLETLPKLFLWESS